MDGRSLAGRTAVITGGSQLPASDSRGARRKAAERIARSQ